MSLRMRPLLNEARLNLMQNDLEVVKTKNGLLPLLDLFVSLGQKWVRQILRSIRQ